MFVDNVTEGSSCGSIGERSVTHRTVFIVSGEIFPASRALSVRQLDGQNTVRYESVNYCAIICGMVFFENKNTTKLLMGTKRAVRMLWQFILSRMSFLLENAIKQIAGILSGFRAQNCLKVCVTTVSDSDQLNEMRQHDL